MNSKYACKLTNCVSCNKKFNGLVLSDKKQQQFCDLCREDSSITIPCASIKKIYGTTDEEFESALKTDKNVHFSININHEGCQTPKYLIKDVERLIEKICENTQDSKRKRLLSNRLKSRRRKIDANVLMRIVQNKENEEIKNLFLSYTRYGRVTYDKFKEEILTADEKITNSENAHESMKQLFDEVIQEKYNDINYYIKYCKIEKSDLNLFLKHYKDFSRVENEIKNYDSKKSYQLFIELYSLKMKTRGEMEKSGIFEKLDNVAINFLTSKIDIIKRTSEIDNAIKLRKLPIKNYWGYDHYCWYIEGGFDKVNSREDRDVNTLDDVIDMIEEMYFYNSKTNYKRIHTEIEKECFRGMFLCATKSDREIDELAKKEAIKLLKKDVLKTAPNLVKKLI